MAHLFIFLFSWSECEILLLCGASSKVYSAVMYILMETGTSYVCKITSSKNESITGAGKVFSPKGDRGYPTPLYFLFIPFLQSSPPWFLRNYPLLQVNSLLWGEHCAGTYHPMSGITTSCVIFQTFGLCYSVILIPNFVFYWICGLDNGWKSSKTGSI